jgi:ATPase family associated with various cellular activities (AAA)
MNLLTAATQLAGWWERFARGERPLPSPADALDFPLLAGVRRKFGLTDAEISIVLILALVEINARARLTLEDFVQIFPNRCDARLLMPGAPLRRWRLIELAPNRFNELPLAARRLALNERLLAHLLGEDTPDERLEVLLDFKQPLPVLTPAQVQCAQAVQHSWRDVNDFRAFRPIALRGNDPAALRAIAWEAARLAGWEMVELRADRLSESADERRECLRLWQVEALLESRALYLDATGLSQNHVGYLRDWASNVGGPVVTGWRDDASLPARFLPFAAPRTDSLDRAQLIGAVLDGRAPNDPSFASRLAEQFDLGAASVYELCSEQASGNAAALWRAFRERSRPQLGPLVQPLESKLGWEDLILPAEQVELLREAVGQVRHRARVHSEWGFAAKSARGLNLTALFSGPSGTGKTMAAEVMANDLELDLLRVDLSAVVSKYIGETEKNLSEVFAAAETGGAILLFDEADALFGPRSKVTDSRDRHANIEVSYLLQRLESFRGLAVLTTNLKENLDQAFLRRIRFHVEFPFPDRAIRSRLWRAAFPSATPLGEIDFERLSRLSLTGGNIRNIALNAAFQAARENTVVRMQHIVNSARSEFRKSEKPVPEGELRKLFDQAAP